LLGTEDDTDGNLEMSPEGARHPSPGQRSCEKIATHRPNVAPPLAVRPVPTGPREKACGFPASG